MKKSELNSLVQKLLELLKNKLEKQKDEEDRSNQIPK